MLCEQIQKILFHAHANYMQMYWTGLMLRAVDDLQ